mgnify:CR=1 FL=1
MKTQMAKSHRLINNFKDQILCNIVIYLISISLFNRIINVRFQMISIILKILALFQKWPFLSRNKLKLKKVECQVKQKLKSLKKLKNLYLESIRILFMISKKKKAEQVAQIINLGWDQKSPKRKLSIKKLKEPITIVNFK